MRKLNIRHRRGVTLLMVTVSIAILTAVAAEFAFQSRVDLELATHQRLYADAKESDQMVVEYFTRSTTPPGGQSRTDLIRRENPSLDERMDKGGHEDALIEGVKRIDFAYWDSDKKDWVDEWDTRRLEKKSILPVRVRIGITAVDETGKEVHYVTQTRIVLNTEIPRF